MTPRTLAVSVACVLTPSVTVAAAPTPAAGAQQSQEAAAAQLRPLLDAYVALTEEHIEGILRGLSLMSATEEVQRGTWDGMKGLLAAFSKSGVPAAAVWFARPDGSYYTVEKGLTDQTLADRAYFPRLMAGEAVVGDLVISKSTGKRSAIFAQPLKKSGKIIGALGISLAMEELGKEIDAGTRMPAKMVFYALDAKGQTSLHRDASRLFAYPSDMGSETLSKAKEEMLAKDEGVLRYSFRGEKTVVFKKSRLTGWAFGLACCEQ